MSLHIDDWRSFDKDEKKKLVEFVRVWSYYYLMIHESFKMLFPFCMISYKHLFLFFYKKFSIPARGEDFVIKSIGKKWKDYKCDLKSVYMTKFKTKDVLLKNKPNRIPRNQWTGLVSYWVS
ncbi:hypothetical protein HAX54_002571 [Datura stramonium]|uniref:Uncharacterized protein n=1 Tax=Datura stramonium TaxID=4076 RepID=A0ABS8WRE1_DATST|nr:hypothetical protein [Datura stramonium]